MSASAPSRRALLGMFALAPLAGTPIEAAEAAVSPAFAEALAAARAATEACSGPDDALSNARDAWEASVAALPHVTTNSSYATQGGSWLHMSTDNPVQVGMARLMLADDTSARAPTLYLSTCRELVEATDVRDAELDRLRQIHGIDALADAASIAEDRSYFADIAVLEYPVSSAADILAKLTFMEERDTFGSEPHAEIIAADIRRVLKGGSI